MGGQEGEISAPWNALGRNHSCTEKKFGFEPGGTKTVSHEIRMSSRDMGKAELEELSEQLGAGAEEN